MADMPCTFLTEEYKAYPSVSHDDMLDCLANLRHPEVLRTLETLRSPYEWAGRERGAPTSYAQARREDVFGRRQRTGSADALPVWCS